MARTSLKNICKLIDSVTESLSPEQEFLNDLKRSIELDDSKNQRIPSKTYKPSGMNCIRASYYQVSGIEPDKSNSSYTLIGICNSGTDIHIRIQTAVEQMKDNGVDCEYIDVADYVKSRNLCQYTPSESSRHRRVGIHPFNHLPDPGPYGKIGEHLHDAPLIRKR